MRQNITLSLDADTLQQARELAAQRHLSISGLLAENLEKQVSGASAYEQAKRQALAWLTQTPLDLCGSYLNRDETHAR